MRRASKIDANQKRIVSALRRTGARVLSLAAVGQGCPDLLVYRESVDSLYMLEIKDGDKPPSAGRNRISPHQRQFHRDWPVMVVCSVDEALKAIGVLK